MSLKERIDNDLKDAMRAKDQLRLNVLRQVKTSVRNKEVELKQECDDTQVVKVLQGLAKQRRDSIEQFDKGGRADLVANEQAELKFLEGYLPAAMSEADLAKLVDEVIAAEGATSPQDMGKVMKVVLAKAAGRADGKVVSALVKQRLK